MRAASPHPRPLALALGGALTLASLVHCSAAPPPPDFLYGPAYGTDDPLAASPQSAVRPSPPAALQSAELAIGRRVLARAPSRALATDGVNVFFGDEQEDALMTVPAAGSAPPSVVERPAPVAIALDGRAIAWIGRPGNIVRRVPRNGESAVTLRERGSFTAIAASRGESFVTENVGEGSVLTRITGSTVTQISAFTVPARAVVVDDNFVYVITATDVLRVPRGGGDIGKVAVGEDLGNPQLDREDIYVTARRAGSHVIMRIPKRGGDAVILGQGVRDAPIAVLGDQVYYFVDGRPELRHVATGGGTPALAVRDDALQKATALAVDQLRLIIGTERDGVIAVTRPR